MNKIADNEAPRISAASGTLGLRHANRIQLAPHGIHRG